MEELSISQAINMKKKLENQLEYYLENKNINFQKTQPKSPTMKDIIAGKSDSIPVFDKYTHYVIKDEEVDQKIYELSREINSLESYILKEQERIAQYGGSELIRYYRDIKKLKWEEIVRLTHYSLRQCHRLYDKK